MFGKFFASTFTGSMFGAGTDVFALWGYVIAHTVDSTVELNPPLVAAILGTTPVQIQAAIEKLCEPDPHSRNPELEGRRLVKEGQFQYRVTSHHIYRDIRNTEDKRAYNRDRQRAHRAKIASQTVSTVTSHSQDESHGKSKSVKEKEKKGIQRKEREHTEADTEAERKRRAAPPPTEVVTAWNTLTSEPIKRCLGLTPKRRRDITRRLTERPLTEWRDIFTRIEQSPFCRGEVHHKNGGNKIGHDFFFASLDWVMQSADVGIKVLEGKYDSHRQSPSVAYRCHHTPKCTSPDWHKVVLARERGEVV